MQVEASIFKSYDIRGTYPDQLHEKVAEAVGKAFCTFLKAPRVIVGRDMRLSGPALSEALIEGILHQGSDVIDIGMVSTDQYYFACATMGLPGLMVTASHNPPQYNGFKMVKEMPQLLSGEAGIQDLRKIIEADAYDASGPKGNRMPHDVRPAYAHKILSLVDVESMKPLKVIIDTANGMVGPAFADVESKLPIHLTSLFPEPDGSVPNHGLDPLQPENRKILEERVVADKADIGFAFDGDGDRFFVIDDRGHFVSGDFMTALLGQYMLEKYPGAKILYDVRASWAVPNLITVAGGIPLMERVGHTYIKRRLAKEGAVFGGEVTGHYYFRDFYGADTGLLPALIVLEMLSKKGKKLSELLAPLEAKYFISGEINTKISGDAKSKMDEIAGHYADAKVEWLDGVSITYPDWHCNVRASNTEPLLRLNVEGVTKEMMEQRRDQLLSLIRG